jgi:hypothetical protein
MTPLRSQGGMTVMGGPSALAPRQAIAEPMLLHVTLRTFGSVRNTQRKHGVCSRIFLAPPPAPPEHGMLPARRAAHQAPSPNAAPTWIWTERRASRAGLPLESGAIRFTIWFTGGARWHTLGFRGQASDRSGDHRQTLASRRALPVGRPHPPARDRTLGRNPSEPTLFQRMEEERAWMRSCRS